MSDLIVIDEPINDITLRWLRGTPKTWSVWRYTLVQVCQPNRWRMKRERVRARRAEAGR